MLCYRCGEEITASDEVGKCQRTFFGESLEDLFYHAEGCYFVWRKRHRE